MTTIFYDFETSSREHIGQILTYAFLVTDESFEIIDECCGQIKLNRTQLPELGAILTNKINIEELNKTGETELKTAEIMFQFLTKWVTKSGNVTLAGFNSNSFDLQFLRNLLIKYGYNPYFKGKLHNKDILHFVQELAFNNPETFDWNLVEKEDGKTYYGFKLEQCATALGLLEGAQTHDARDDVVLTIELTKALEKKYEASFKAFQPFSIFDHQMDQSTQLLGKQKTRDYPEAGEMPEKFVNRYYWVFSQSKKNYLALDLEKVEKSLNEQEIDQETVLSWVKYINENKAFFKLEPLSEQERHVWDATLSKLTEFPILKELAQNLNKYFEYLPRDWDIEYQIHLLGFKQIDELKVVIDRLMADPNQYMPIIKELMAKRKGPEDNYLIQLFNRAYLNCHPNPKPQHVQKYLFPRYVTGEMLRNWNDFESIDQRLEEIDETLADENLSETDRTNIEALKRYTQTIQELCLIPDITHR